MKDDLEPARGVAANLSSRDLAIVGHADLIGNIFIGQLLFGLADEGDLRDRIDAVRIVSRIGVRAVVVEGASHGDAALLHRYRRERREADDVADGEDVRRLGAVVLVHRDPSAGVRFDPGILEIEPVDVAAAAYSVKQRVALDALLALQVCDYIALRQFFNAL